VKLFLLGDNWLADVCCVGVKSSPSQRIHSYFQTTRKSISQPLRAEYSDSEKVLYFLFDQPLLVLSYDCGRESYVLNVFIACFALALRVVWRTWDRRVRGLLQGSANDQRFQVGNSSLLSVLPFATINQIVHGACCQDSGATEPHGNVYPVFLCIIVT
jgi:hypothetical protein